MQENTEKKLYFTAIVNETREIPTFECVTAKNTDYVKYGSTNNFPDYLYDLYEHSSQFSAIVETMLRYIEGSKIESNYPMKVVNRKGETFNDLVEKLIIDYLIFGGFAFQVTRNKLNEISELNWIDFRYVRVNEDEDKVFYSTEWNKGRRKPKVYDRYTNGSEYPTSIFYYKGRKTRTVYPQPMYMSALTSLEISTQIPEFHLNNLVNGLHPSAIVNFNNGSNLSESVMDEIEEKIKGKFSGVKNASKIMLSFNDDLTHKTTIERLPDDGLVDIYNTLKESVEKDIFTAFRISKLLLGDASDNTGFNKQAYMESFSLFNKTVIEPMQREIEGVINGVLGDGSLYFDRFEIDWGADEDTDTSKIID